MTPLVHGFTKNLMPCSGCGGISGETINQIIERKVMQYMVNQQVVVEADSPEQALEKTKPNEGNRVSFNVNPKPQPPQDITRGIGTMIPRS